MQLTPEIVPEIAKQVRAKTDLREFQGELFRTQRAVRTINRAATLRKMAKRRHRMRVRLPLLTDCKVLDTRTDSRGKLYFELENGMAVRADHAAAQVRKSGTVHGYASPSKITNPVVRKIVIAEIERNATRGEKAA